MLAASNNGKSIKKAATKKVGNTPGTKVVLTESFRKLKESWSQLYNAAEEQQLRARIGLPASSSGGLDSSRDESSLVLVRATQELSTPSRGARAGANQATLRALQYVHEESQAGFRAVRDEIRASSLAAAQRDAERTQRDNETHAALIAAMNRIGTAPSVPQIEYVTTPTPTRPDRSSGPAPQGNGTVATRTPRRTLFPRDDAPPRARSASPVDFPDINELLRRDDEL